MSQKALFSLYDTTNSAKYAKALIDLGWDIIATRETVDILKEEGLSCEDIASFTGVTHDFGIPPTLHPKIENALTMDAPDERIELVYDIPYPLEEGNDVGGRVLLALAAKGNRVPVFTREDMEVVISNLKENGSIPDDLRNSLIDKANAEIAAHYLKLVDQSGRGKYTGLIGKFEYSLMNGENPYQVAGLFSTCTDDPLSIPRLELLSETKPCYTNLADVACIVDTVCLTCAAFNHQYNKLPFITIASKHGNPTGLCVSWVDPAITITKALFGDPMAIWGGELITNFSIDTTLAELMIRSSAREESIGSAGWMLDVVIAPEYSNEALDMLRKRKFRKIFRNSELKNPTLNLNRHAYRGVRGGFIRQSPPARVLKLEEAEVTGDGLSEEAVDSIIVAWSAAFRSFHGGNEVAVAKNRNLIRVGGGPSTVSAAETAVLRGQGAKHDLSNSVFAADAFFPFTDAPQVLIDA